MNQGHEYGYNKFKEMQMQTLESLLKNIKLDSNSTILDIGCGRGKILGNLKSKLKLRIKPFGIDIIDHTDKDKRINFKKIDALKFFDKNKYKFDLILIKQTIHLLSLSEIKKLLKIAKKNLTLSGKIFISEVAKRRLRCYNS